MHFACFSSSVNSPQPTPPIGQAQKNIPKPEDDGTLNRCLQNRIRSATTPGRHHAAVTKSDRGTAPATKWAAATAEIRTSETARAGVFGHVCSAPEKRGSRWFLTFYRMHFLQDTQDAAGTEQRGGRCVRPCVLRALAHAERASLLFLLSFPILPRCQAGT